MIRTTYEISHTRPLRVGGKCNKKEWSIRHCQPIIVDFGDTFDYKGNLYVSPADLGALNSKEKDFFEEHLKEGMTKGLKDLYVGNIEFYSSGIQFHLWMREANEEIEVSYLFNTRTKTRATEKICAKIKVIGEIVFIDDVFRRPVLQEMQLIINFNEGEYAISLDMFDASGQKTRMYRFANTGKQSWISYATMTEIIRL